MEDLDPADVTEIAREVSGRSLPLAYNEGRLLELLSVKLDKYLPQPDIQMILDDLRSELYAGIDLGSIRTLHTVTKNCRKCPNLIADPQLPAWNKVDPDCLFIMDQPPTTNETSDFFITRLVKAGFSSKRVCLSYVNRCRSPNNKYTLEEVKNCTSYLLTEIQLLQPKLIVVLGVTAASLILGTQIKLADDHGRILWLGPWSIMPIYSPSYVLMGASHLAATFENDLEYAYKYCYGDQPK